MVVEEWHCATSDPLITMTRGYVVKMEPFMCCYQILKFGFSLFCHGVRFLFSHFSVADNALLNLLSKLDLRGSWKK